MTGDRPYKYVNSSTDGNPDAIENKKEQSDTAAKLT